MGEVWVGGLMGKVRVGFSERMDGWVWVGVSNLLSLTPRLSFLSLTQHSHSPQAPSTQHFLPLLQGDSGGPLMCRNHPMQPWQLVGVYSFLSNGCNSPMKPPVFTNVTYHLPWIRKQLGGELWKGGWGLGEL